MIMKDIKLSFPFPKTSRHNLSQDVALSLSMGLVTPVRVVEVLPGDSHRIGASYSLVSNPLVKPLLQGVRMRYCRFWVPRRIYHLDQRANNSNFDPREAPVRYGAVDDLKYPQRLMPTDTGAPWTSGPYNIAQYSNFQASSLFDYLGIAGMESNMFSSMTPVASDAALPALSTKNSVLFHFNAEPYLAYLDICRNYFADSASGSVAWAMPYESTVNVATLGWRCTVVSPLSVLDSYIDGVQNGSNIITPYNPMLQPDSSDKAGFSPVLLSYGSVNSDEPLSPAAPDTSAFSVEFFGVAHAGLCVPVSRPDRFSRSFDTRPLVSQNAVIASSEISIANLSFLAKLQRYLTRKFFGGSRFTDVMYSVFGQRVPHVDSPVCLDVFDVELGTELVASTNASAEQNPGVLGGYFASSGYLSTNGNRQKKRYFFNEAGYLVDVVYIMPRVYRSGYYPDFYPVTESGSSTVAHMSQGNFIPDMNGIGWQQPAYVQNYLYVAGESSGIYTLSNLPGFVSEPSWQQYRTLPDVCHGLLNINRSSSSSTFFNNRPRLNQPVGVNTPLFVFNDRPWGYNMMKTDGSPYSEENLNLAYFRMLYTDFNIFNSVFGTAQLTLDNLFCVFSFAHQAKRQVSKRFTLSF